MFYGYVGFVGFAVWATLNWVFKGTLSLAQVLCTYGESPSYYGGLHGTEGRGLSLGEYWVSFVLVGDTTTGA